MEPRIEDVSSWSNIEDAKQPIHSLLDWFVLKANRSLLYCDDYVQAWECVWFIVQEEKYDADRMQGKVLVFDCDCQCLKLIVFASDCANGSGQSNAE